MFNIVFDLDGTLVDSAPSILAAISDAFNECGLESDRPLTKEIIGPPLKEMLSTLVAARGSKATDQLTEAFKVSYDNVRVGQTPAFEGVDALLGGLISRGHRLFIATNKREMLAKRIVKNLGWESIFEGVYGLDGFDPPKSSKVELLAQLLTDLRLAKVGTIYVGDREEDGYAADSNGIAFVHATWGYEGDEMRARTKNNWGVLRRPDADVLSGFLKYQSENILRGCW